MEKNSFGATGVIAALLGVALAIQAAGAGDATSGKAVYSNKCMICHGADGEGTTGYAKATRTCAAQVRQGSEENGRPAENNLLGGVGQNETP